ncbi:MAG: RimK family alpha-L-glutamate ligase [Planctomycetaceae bacterium]|nr:RimK family alpha-L-glutamate ligase [Planctomycetaceae bacterium]
MHLGILGSKDSRYVAELRRAAEARGHRVSPLLFEEFCSTVEHGRLQLRCGMQSLTELDAILVRTMPPGTLEQVVARMDLLAGVEAQGVRIVNSPRSLECAVDKYLTTQRLALAGLPVPDTIVCENTDAAMDAFERLGRDVVVKPLFGAEGRGIMRISDPELAHRTFQTLSRLGAVLYLQRFLNGPRFDLRLLCLDGRLIGSMKRIPREGDFRANISQQGIGMLHQPTADEERLAFEAAKVTGAVFAGVDLMYDSQDQLQVIEVNAVPGWKGLEKACGVDVPGQLMEWLEG